MQNERPTAGETATPFNRYEQEIHTLNQERNAKRETIIAEIQDLKSEMQDLKLWRTSHHEAIEALNVKIDAIKGRLRELNDKDTAICAEYRKLKEKVVDEANAYYAKFPGENWMWKKVYGFFKENPGELLRYMEKKEKKGGEQ